MKRKLKLILGPIIIIITLIAFTWYISRNPAVIDQLKQTSITTVTVITILYGVVLGSLMIIMHASLQLFQKRMDTQENYLLNSYSLLINFFGPGQSGPGFRGIYLKVKHGVKIKQYIFATLIYYAFFALFSGLMLFGVSRPVWQTVIVVSTICLACLVIIKYFLRQNTNIISSSLNKGQLVQIGALFAIATLAQVLLITAVYYIELSSLDSSISFSQALAYTGAANFALFVSLTPGAIGIREAFLLFSQNLHHISSDLIVAANVLDRAVFILFLGILFILALIMHAGSKLQVKKVQKEAGLD